MPVPLVASRLVVFPEVPPVVALARVVVASGRYGPAREPDDVRRVVGVAVPGALFEHLPVAVLLPRPFAFYGDAVLPDPRFQVELQTTVAAGAKAGFFAERSRGSHDSQ